MSKCINVGFIVILVLGLAACKRSPNNADVGAKPAASNGTPSLPDPVHLTPLGYDPWLHSSPPIADSSRDTSPIQVDAVPISNTYEPGQTIGVTLLLIGESTEERVIQVEGDIRDQNDTTLTWGDVFIAGMHPTEITVPAGESVATGEYRVLHREELAAGHYRVRKIFTLPDGSRRFLVYTVVRSELQSNPGHP